MSRLPHIDQREFPYSERQFEQIRTLLYQHAGISLHDSKMEMVYSRLARRLRALKLSRFEDYLRDLKPEHPEWQEFLNALTTNLTSFFRESHHFDRLQQQVGAALSEGQPISIWSSAASTGEEAYSIALALVEAAGSYDINVSITATDIDTGVLETAKRGIYREDAISKLEQHRRKSGFLRGRANNAGMIRVRPELARLVEFSPLNLLHGQTPPGAPFDAIFCRNVLIYFDKATQRRVLQYFPAWMKPGALLYVGHSENLMHMADVFAPLGQTVYRVK